MIERKTDLNKIKKIFEKRKIAYQTVSCNGLSTILSLCPKSVGEDSGWSVEVIFDKDGKLKDFGLWR